MAFGKAAAELWKKTRPSECKDSGIAEGCIEYEKKCPPSRSIKKADIPAAREAAAALLKAIGIADGKLGGIKKPDEKKKVAIAETKKLLVPWERSVKGYQGELDEAAAKILTEETGKVQEAAETEIQRVVDSQFESLTENLKDMNDAVRSGKAAALEDGIKASARATFTIKNASKTLTKGYFVQCFDTAAKTLKFDVESSKAVLPTKMPQWQKLLDSYEKSLDELRDKIDDLVDQQDAEPDMGGKDPNYARDFKKLVVAYKDNIAEMKAGMVKGQKLLVIAKKITAGATVVRPEDTQGTEKLATARKTVIKATGELEEELKALAATYRDTTNGKLALQRKAVNPPAEDVNKYLAPLTTRMNDGNLRATRVVQMVRTELGGE